MRGILSFWLGPDALVVLKTSPFAPPDWLENSRTSSGFELDVAVRMVLEGSTQRALGGGGRERQCQFNITPSAKGKEGDEVADGKSGFLRQVAHALPANSTCRYRLVGKPGDRLWLTFFKFEVTHHKEDAYRAPDCANRMALFEGSGQLLGEFCEDSPPRMCEQALLQNQDDQLPSRPCTGRNESYLSQSSELVLVVTLGQSTAVRPLLFTARYEFVDVMQDGAPANAISSTERPKKHSTMAASDLHEGWTCDRVFDSVSYSHVSVGQRGASFPFSSPDNG